MRRITYNLIDPVTGAVAKAGMREVGWRSWKIPYRIVLRFLSEFQRFSPTCTEPLQTKYLWNNFIKSSCNHHYVFNRYFQQVPSNVAIILMKILGIRQNSSESLGWRIPQISGFLMNSDRMRTEFWWFLTEFWRNSDLLNPMDSALPALSTWGERFGCWATVSIEFLRSEFRQNSVRNHQNSVRILSEFIRNPDIWGILKAL